MTVEFKIHDERLNAHDMVMELVGKTNFIETMGQIVEVFIDTHPDSLN